MKTTKSKIKGNNPKATARQVESSLTHVRKLAEIRVSIEALNQEAAKEAAALQRLVGKPPEHLGTSWLSYWMDCRNYDFESVKEWEASITAVVKAEYLKRAAMNKLTKAERVLLGVVG